MSTRGEKLLTGVLIASVALNVFLLLLAINFRTNVTNLTQQNNELASYLRYQNTTVNQLRTLTEDLNMTRKQLEYYRNQAEYYSSLLRGRGASTGVSGKSSVSIVAVQQIQNRSGFFLKGVVMKLEVELREGEGRVLINTIPKIGIDLQTSARTSVLVAENITGAKLQKTDVIVTIIASEPVTIVDGPSAGIAITVATIAAIKNETLLEGVMATGTVNPDGSVGPIGGLLEKGEAAAMEGGRVFVVPKGQSTVLVQVPVRYSQGIFTIIVYETRKVDVEDYLKERGFNLQVIEADNVLKAYEIFRSLAASPAHK